MKRHSSNDEVRRELPSPAFGLTYTATKLMEDEDAQTSCSSTSASEKLAPRLLSEDVFGMSVDELLSRDLQNMKFEDRNRVDEEMHGVATLCPDETPELLQHSLRDLQLAIDAMPVQDKTAYQEAQQYHGTYVNEMDFRLRFLRTELFDVPKAARRMVKFLDLVKTYYGVVALQRPIRLSDFGK